jgi:hypothetical protein
MYIKPTTLISFICLLISSFLNAQTGPSQPGQESLSIFAGSGQNQLIIAEISPDISNVSVVSQDESLVTVIQTDFTAGNPFAVLKVEEKGKIGLVKLTISLDDGTDVSERTLDVNVVNYNIPGINFEIHDIVFWQEAIPLGGMPVFDTIIQTGQGPYASLNYDNIPITVNLDCTTSPPLHRA